MKRNAEALITDIKTRIEARIQVLETNLRVDNQTMDSKEATDRIKYLIWELQDCLQELIICYDYSSTCMARFEDLRSLYISPLLVMLDTENIQLSLIVPITRAMTSMLDATMRDVYGSFTKSSHKYLGEIFPPTTNREESVMNEYYIGLAREEIATIVRHIVLSQDRRINYMVQTFHADYPSIQLMEEEEIKERMKFYAMFKGGFSIQAAERLLMEKVAIGSDATIVASNGCFDIIQLRTVHDDGISRMAIDGKVLPSKEEKQIERTFKYLRDSGIAIITIPSFALAKKTAILLAKSGKLIQMFMAEPRGGFDCTVVIVVQKCDRSKEQQDTDYATYRNAFHVEASRPRRFSELNIETDFDFSSFPHTVCQEPRIFKGGLPDSMAMIIALQSSQAYDIKEFTNDIVPKPLLPFNQGQVGLVLASGKLDGIIDEGENFKHVIRGRVFKQRRTTKKFEWRKTPSENDMVTETQRMNNCIEINLFAGDGSYKQIAVAN